MANICPETTENLSWFLTKWFFNPWGCRISYISFTEGCERKTCLDSIPFGWISRLPCTNSTECVPYSITTVGPSVAFYTDCAEKTVINAARKVCPTASCSLTACEWVPDFSALKLIEIIPSSQNDSVTSQQFKQALPSLSTGLTMWQWLVCCNVQHSMKACFYLRTPKLICSKLFPHCP